MSDSAPATKLVNFLACNYTLGLYILSMICALSSCLAGFFFWNRLSCLL